ncbi:MAG: adenylyl-sulfate kinase [Candidatus Thioglobus sp.]
MSSDNVVWHSTKITQEDRLKRLNQRPCIIWFTGLSASGKSSTANAVEQQLFQRGHMTYLLDGDNLRHGLSQDLGFREEDRIENIRRIGEVGKLFLDAGLIVLCAFISPFRADRQIARNLVNKDDFIEVFVDTPLEVCEQRDPKGLYKKARSGNITNFTGIDSPYEIPKNPEVRVCGYDQSVIDSSLAVIQFLEDNNYI